MGIGKVSIIDHAIEVIIAMSNPQFKLNDRVRLKRSANTNKFLEIGGYGTVIETDGETCAITFDDNTHVTGLTHRELDIVPATSE